ncbi:MAG: DUF4892 domain-containing protein [Neptuniibacter sp.]
MLKFWMFLVTVLLPLELVAGSDINNSSDYNRLERFPASNIVQYKQSKNQDYRLILGGLAKINGVLRAEKEQRLSGRLTQITYRIPENHSSDEAFEYVNAQIRNQGGKELFRCSGRDCGSSNQWANNIFRYFRLYGVDSSQSFASFQLDDAYISVYAVKRGNKRVYLRLDILETEVIGAGHPDTQKAGLSIELTSTVQVNSVVDYLNQNADSLIWIVSYDFNPGTKQEQLSRSVLSAEELKSKLAAAGVAPSKIFIHASGSFTTNNQLERGTKLMVYSEKRTE